MTFSDPEQEPEGIRITEKRRFDDSGELREPRHAAPEPADAVAPDADRAPAELSALELALAERTADLQRLQAEYVNYKRRVDRDRDVVRESAVASVLGQLLPVLDDIGRADEHGELTGGFKAVADSLDRAVTALGLERFGEVGEPFDPRVHEALMHRHSDDVAGPVCEAVLQAGYRIGERVLRPARVAVAEPESYVPDAVEPLADNTAEAADTETRPGD